MSRRPLVRCIKSPSRKVYQALFAVSPTCLSSSFVFQKLRSCVARESRKPVSIEKGSWELGPTVPTSHQQRLAEKEAAHGAATGQAGTVKRVSEEAKRHRRADRTRHQCPCAARLLTLIGPTSAKQGRFLKVCKSAKHAPILDLRLGRLWEERRASAGGLWCDQIDRSSPR